MKIDLCISTARICRNKLLFRKRFQGYRCKSSHKGLIEIMRTMFKIENV